jgi:tetratricopeptide (TPR) repeat protein
MGQVMEERKNDVDGAIACYGDAVRADPTLRLALRRLREIHSRRNQWDVALQIAETELGLSMPVAERAALRAEMGLIWLDALSDAATAQAEFEQALAENPAESRALGGAARALEVLGRPREAAAAWKRLAAQLAGPERARALVAQARILSEELEQGELAFDLYRRALGDDPENAEALDALAIEAAASERWDLLADLHERRFARARSTQRKSEIALEAGLVHAEKRRDLDLAHTWLSRSVEVAPEFITVRRWKPCSRSRRSIRNRATICEPWSTWFRRFSWSLTTFGWARPTPARWRSSVVTTIWSTCWSGEPPFHSRNPESGLTC